MKWYTLAKWYDKTQQTFKWLLHNRKKLNYGKHKKKEIHHYPPWRLPIIGNRKLTPEEQRELFQLNEWILKTLKQDWVDNHLK